MDAWEVATEALQAVGCCEGGEIRFAASTAVSMRSGLQRRASRRRSVHAASAATAAAAGPMPAPGTIAVPVVVGSKTLVTCRSTSVACETDASAGACCLRPAAGTNQRQWIMDRASSKQPALQLSADNAPRANGIIDRREPSEPEQGNPKRWTPLVDPCVCAMDPFYILTKSDDGKRR